MKGDAIKLAPKLAADYGASFTWASWPCQAGHSLTKGTNATTRLGTYPQLIPGGREVMQEIGLPWVIENTQGAPIRKDLTLVGDMFREPDGTYPLQVWRPRYFELSGFSVPQPPMPKRRGRTRGWRHGEVIRDGWTYLAVYGSGGGKANLAEARVAMEMPWAGKLKECTEAIPPRYSRYIGEHAIKELGL